MTKCIINSKISFIILIIGCVQPQYEFFQICMDRRLIEKKWLKKSSHLNIDRLELVFQLRRAIGGALEGPEYSTSLRSVQWSIEWNIAAADYGRVVASNMLKLKCASLLVGRFNFGTTKQSSFPPHLLTSRIVSFLLLSPNLLPSFSLLENPDKTVSFTYS